MSGRELFEHPSYNSLGLCLVTLRVIASALVSLVLTVSLRLTSVSFVPMLCCWLLKYTLFKRSPLNNYRYSSPKNAPKYTVSSQKRKNCPGEGLCSLCRSQIPILSRGRDLSGVKVLTSVGSINHGQNYSVFPLKTVYTRACLVYQEYLVSR